jgi:molecular chaperone DnaK
MEGGKPMIIPNNEGRNTTPSIIGFLKDGDRVVGDPAKRQGVTNPTKTITSIKRFMGEKYSTVKDREHVPYEIVQGSNDIVKVKIDEKEYSAQELSAIVLQKMKKTAEDYLGFEVKKAVITVPAYFSDSQRQATKEAGEIAGLEVCRIINEPTAAALAFGLDKKDDMKVAVFDFGGGTFDISVLELGGGVFEVKSTDGNTHLGGDDVDRVIINFLADEFHKEYALDLRKDPMALQRLKEAAEKAKIELSNSIQTEINLPYIMPVDGIPKHLVQTITRAKFEQMIGDIIQRTIEPCKSALKNANMTTSDIDEIILVGGSTRIPAVQEAVEKFFGKKPNKGVNPDEVVAIGAAIQGSVLAGETDDVLLLDVTPLSLGIETLGSVFTKLIDANTTIPVERSQIFSTAVDNQPAVTIRVGQGERPSFNDNKLLGVFDLDGIPSARRGTPQIEVTFSIDANGIMSVKATDKGTNKEQHITIQSSSGLSADEVERMKREAEENAEADKKKMEKVHALNKADSLVFSTEKQLEEMGDKVTEDEKSKLQPIVDELKEVLKNQNHEKVEELSKKLEEAWIPISARIYAQSNPDGNSNPFANMGSNPFAGGDNPFGGFDFTKGATAQPPPSPSEDTSDPQWAEEVDQK